MTSMMDQIKSNSILMYMNRDRHRHQWHIYLYTVHRHSYCFVLFSLLHNFIVMFKLKESFSQIFTFSAAKINSQISFIFLAKQTVYFGRFWFLNGDDDSMK